MINRYGLGLCMMAFGLAKAGHPENFLKTVHEYGIFTQPLLLNVVSACLPWFEIFLGMLLLTRFAVKSSALILAALLLSFTVAIVWRGAGISAKAGLPFCATRFDCGCGQGTIWICWKLVENLALVLSALWVLLGHSLRVNQTQNNL